MTKKEQIKKIEDILIAHCEECAEESGWCIHLLAKILVNKGIGDKDRFYVIWEKPKDAPPKHLGSYIVKPIDYE